MPSRSTAALTPPSSLSLWLAHDPHPPRPPLPAHLSPNSCRATVAPGSTLDCCNAHLTAIVCDDNPASAEMQKKLTDLGSEKRETHESQLHEDFRNEF